MAALDNDLLIETREMHTGGEPLRIVERGYPPILGDTILEQRAYAKANLDRLRRVLMYEPRGHYDMYGALLVKPTLPEADAVDLAVLFMHNEGYSTMCGHGVIALGRYAIDTGIVKNPTAPETEVRIQCPCGLVTAFTEYDEKTKKTGATRFHSVPSYAYKLGHKISLSGEGKDPDLELDVDVAYGGAFYALVPGEKIGVNVVTSPITDIVKAATAVKAAVMQSLQLQHPDSPDLAFLYGVIVTDGNDEYDPDTHTASVTVFADSEVDRSPCGSGTTARMAAMFARGLVRPNQTRTFTNAKTGSVFAARIVDVLPGKGAGAGAARDEAAAVVVEVKGNAYYTGTSTFTVEDDDALKGGFLVR